MIHSNQRKLCLSGWLQSENEQAYSSPLRLQKFLFLYECFSKVDKEKYDFSSLKGYERGPVFSNVWGDYTKERAEFDEQAICSYNNNLKEIHLERASQCSYIVSVLSERELSDLTHLFHIWNAQEDRIKAREHHVVLNDQDFNDQDIKIVEELKSMYPLDIVSNTVIIHIGEKNFVLSKRDESRLTEEHYDVLFALSNNPELHNPVYLTIDEKGKILVD